MKFPDFQYSRPADLAEALDLLAANDQATLMAGGQSLLTVMGFRLAAPEQIIDISNVPDLTRIEHGEASVTIGAAVRHAAIEDGAVTGALGAFLSQAARNIGYRAIRNRGTMGGSLAHADPAADWPVVLTALEADIEIADASGRRSLPMEEFILGEMTTALEPGELIARIRIVLAKDAGYGVHKIARKKGEFANAIAAAVLTGDAIRFTVGIIAGKPLVFRVELAPGEIDLTARLSGTEAYKAISGAITEAVPGADEYEGHLAAIAACHAARAAWDDRKARS